MLNIAVFVSGNGSNLQNLIDDGTDISLVVSSKEDAYALKRASDNNIGTFILKNIEDEKKLLYILEEKNIELIVLAGFLKVISPSFIQNFKGEIINIHPSLLPAYGGKGMYGLKVHEAVLKNNEKFSGATVHLVDETVDGGRILEQIEIPVYKDDTPSTLQTRIMEKGEKIILPKVVKRLCERNFE